MLGKMLKNVREKTNISQKEMASFLNVSQQALSRWEKSQTEPDYKTLIKISNYFDVSIDYLLGKTEIKNYENPFEDNIEKQLFKKIKTMNKKQKKKILDVTNIFFPDDEV